MAPIGSIYMNCEGVRGDENMFKNTVDGFGMWEMLEMN